MARAPRLNRDPGGYRAEARSAASNQRAASRAAGAYQRRGDIRPLRARASSSGQRRDSKGRFA